MPTRAQELPEHSFSLTQEGIFDLLEPLQEQKSNLFSLISLTSVLLSSQPLPPSFIHPSASHLSTLSPCGMLNLRIQGAAMWIKGRTIAKSAPESFIYKQSAGRGLEHFKLYMLLGIAFSEGQFGFFF